MQECRLQQWMCRKCQVEEAKELLDYCKELCEKHELTFVMDKILNLSTMLVRQPMVEEHD